MKKTPFHRRWVAAAAAMGDWDEKGVTPLALWE